jgi:hypothetical protein
MYTQKEAGENPSLRLNQEGDWVGLAKLVASPGILGHRFLRKDRKIGQMDILLRKHFGVISS